MFYSISSHVSAFSGFLALPASQRVGQQKNRPEKAFAARTNEGS